MADAGEPARNPLALVEGLLTPMRRLMGDEAGTSLFHYAAVQEGRRLAGSMRVADLPSVLARLDEMLGQRTELRASDKDGVTVRIHTPHAVGTTESALTVLVGLLEGVVGALYGRPATGRVVSVEGDVLDVEIATTGGTGSLG